MAGFMKHKEYIYTSSEEYLEMEGRLKTLSLFLLFPFFVIFALACFFAIELFNSCDSGHSWWAHGGFFITIVVLAIYENRVYKSLLLRIDNVRKKVALLPN